MNFWPKQNTNLNTRATHRLILATNEREMIFGDHTLFLSFVDIIIIIIIISAVVVVVVVVVGRRLVITQCKCMQHTALHRLKQSTRIRIVQIYFACFFFFHFNITREESERCCIVLWPQTFTYMPLILHRSMNTFRLCFEYMYCVCARNFFGWMRKRNRDYFCHMYELCDVFCCWHLGLCVH